MNVACQEIKNLIKRNALQVKRGYRINSLSTVFVGVGV